jgi:hypothetical protein
MAYPLNGGPDMPADSRRIGPATGSGSVAQTRGEDVVEKIMMDRKFQSGDRVRHRRRPEWGIGSVVKAEGVTANGQRAQRISIRFPNAGLKTLSTAHAELELVGDGHGLNGSGHPLAGWEKLDQSEWLAPLARKKVEEALASLPPDARDPFNSVRTRLELSLDLYRFERTGRSLIDWAVAQTGIDDPLSRFSRQELEQHFDRYAAERDGHLARLLQEARAEPSLLDEILASSPRAAHLAVRRLTGER